MGWDKQVRVYLGEKVKAAKVTDNTVDFREAFAFSTRLKWEKGAFNNVVIQNKSAHIKRSEHTYFRNAIKAHTFPAPLPL